MGRAYRHTFAARLTFVWVDIGMIVSYTDSVKRAGAHA